MNFVTINASVKEKLVMTINGSRLSMKSHNNLLMTIYNHSCLIYHYEYVPEVHFYKILSGSLSNFISIHARMSYPSLWLGGWYVTLDRGVP